MSYVNDNTYSVENSTKNNILIDMCDSDKKKHHSPMELILSAVTSCAAVEIVSMIKKRKREFNQLIVLKHLRILIRSLLNFCMRLRTILTQHQRIF